MRQLLLYVMVLLCSACGQGSQNSSAPPGFTDDPPPPPVSETVILSGGTLLSPDPIPDSLVILTRGRVVGWGRRGSVDVPNESIGSDMRGKWIVAGRLVNGQPRIDHELLKSGAPANLLFLSSDPAIASPAADHVVGYAADGELTLPESD